MAYKFKQTEKLIGSFIVISLIIIISAVIFIARGQHLLTKKFYYKTGFNSAASLSEGMPVKYKGLKIGLVKKIYLDENDQIILRFYVLKKYSQKIRKDSVVMLNAPLIGEKFIELSTGMTNSSMAADGDFLYSADSEKGREFLAIQLAHAPDSPTDLIIKNVQLLTAQLSDPNGSFMKTLNNFQQLSASLAENRGTIQETMSALKDSAKNMKELSKGLKDNPFFGGSWSGKKKK
ncbi:MAG: MCE family protein [Spirochaetes bacterium]|nr:MCE family protein [Spirochaetota bacterium]